MILENGKTYVIAEAGVNHNGSIDMAMGLVDVACDAGADAIKFQSFKTEKLLSKSAPKAEYQMHNTSELETQFDMIKKLELNEDAHRKLLDYCIKKGIQFLSTPFDIESLVLLVEGFDIPVIKIPSGEITNAPFILEITKYSKPVILSTGMSTMSDIEQALGVLAFGYQNSGEEASEESFRRAYCSDKGRAMLATKVSLLHCTTEYPAPFEEVNLRAMDTMATAFGLPVGYSDHTQGIAMPIAAVARGAEIIEKHFTLDRSLPGPDHKASLEPEELAAMITEIRHAEMALGHGIKIATPSELKNRAVARKSLVAIKDIKKGEKFTADNLGVKRPGNGVPPIYFWHMLGRVADCDYRADDMVKL